MYRWLCQIHLFAGLCFFPFALMYGVSAIGMSHNAWFRSTPTVIRTKAFVPPEKASDGRAVARELIAQSLVWGELTEIKTTADGYRLELHRPGGSFEVDYSRGTGEARVTNTQAGTLSALIKIHHIASINYPYWLNNLWGALLGLTALALIAAGVTGVCMWLKLPGERTVGTVLLVLALGYSLSVLVAIRMAG